MMGATGAAAMAGKSLQGYDSELESESLCFSLLPDELNYNQLTWAQIPDGPRGQAARLDNATMPQRLKVGKVYPGPPQRLAEYGIGGAVEASATLFFPLRPLVPRLGGILLQRSLGTPVATRR